MRRFKTLPVLLALLSVLFLVFSFIQPIQAADPPAEAPPPAAKTLEASTEPLPGHKTVEEITGSTLDPNPVAGGNIFAQSGADFKFMKDMWVLTRRLTNIMVVIFLFIAAAATTLNFQVSTYGIKKTLPSVLLATLYANFSYAIAEFFNSINIAIVKAFTGNASDALGIIANYIHGPLDGWYNKITVEAGWGGNMMAILALIILGALAIGLFFLVLLFFIRNYFLAMIVAVAPLAFMTLAMPFTASAFRKWWDYFIKWMFFPAIAGFWLYLGAIALGASTAAGSLVGLVMSGLILWMAIKTPFTIGAVVGGVAGFVTGYATKGAKTAIGAGKTVGKAGANLALGGPWDKIRLRAAAGYEKTLPGRMGRARKQARSRLEKNLELERGRAAWIPTDIADQNGRNPWRRLNNVVQNYLATNVGNMELNLSDKESRNNKEGAIAKRNAAINPARRERNLQSGRDKIETETAEAQMKRAQLEGEEAARRNNPLSLTLAEAQEAVAGLEDSISGITSLYKKQAVEANDALRGLRRIGVARKELGEKAYQLEMARIKQESREGSDEIAIALGDELVQAMGRGFEQGGFNQAKLRRAMVELSGGSQDIEETLKSVAEKDLNLYQVRKLAADDVFESMPSVSDHSLDQNAFIQQLVADNVITVDPNGQITYQATAGGNQLRMAANKMGVGHLTNVADQIESIRQFTSLDNKEFRDAARVNGQKARGKARASAMSFVSDEASDQTAYGVTLGSPSQQSRIIAGIRAMENPGAGSVQNIGTHLNLNTMQDIDSSDAVAAANMRAVDQLHGLLLRFKKKSNQAEVFSEANTLLNAMAPVLVQLGYAPTATAVGRRATQVSAEIPGNPGVTVGTAIAHLRGGGEYTDSSNQVIKNAHEFVRDAILRELSPVVHMREDTTLAIKR